MEKKYISGAILRTAQPRSKRLRELGRASENGVSSTVVSVDGSSSSDFTGDGHTHANKATLDEISTDDDRYIYLKKLEVSDDGTIYESLIKKAKAGYADKAHDIDDNSPVYEKFLRKDVEDTAAGLITFINGLLIGKKEHGINVNESGDVIAILDELNNIFRIISPGFVSGDLGSGFILKHDPDTGRSYLEVDELLVRKVAYFVELVIKRLRYVGGEIILTPASMKCTKVEDMEEVYRCYFQQDDGNKSIMQEFASGDQVRCQTFNIKADTSHDVTNKYYWRLVVSVGDDYIDLSKMDCDPVSSTPESGDEIVLLGNRNDVTRQNAIILSTIGDDAPSIKQYKGISNYTLTGKEVTIISPALNKFVGQFISEATGKSYDDMINGLQTDFDIVKAQTDREYTIWFFDYIPTLNNLPASEWNTGELKAMHDQDLFYNTSNVPDEGGRAWRFGQDEDGTYSWSDITDQQTVKALEYAAKAQDTADGKRRVFVEQPTDEQTYDVGDLWVNATYPTAKPDPYENDTLVCQTGKASGIAFDIEHWKPANYGTTATIKNMGDRIEVVAKKFNEDGTLKSGLIAESDFASLFTSQVDKDKNIVKQADITTFIKQNADGTIESGVNISADQINFLGKTIINGNFIVDTNGNLTLNNITANNLTLSGNISGNNAVLNDITLNNIVATSGTFNTLTGTSGEDEMLLSPSLLRFTNQYVSSFFGADTTPATSGGFMINPIRVCVNRVIARYDAGANAALYLDVQGAKAYDDYTATGNHALYIPHGDICGIRRRLRWVKTSQSLSLMDSVLVCINTEEITVTLPAGAEDGQEYWMISANGKRVNVIAASGDTISTTGDFFASTLWHVYIYDALNKIWFYGYMKNS